MQPLCPEKMLISKRQLGPAGVAQAQARASMAVKARHRTEEQSQYHKVPSISHQILCTASS